MYSTDYLKEKVKQIPESPGIYKMLDPNNNIIYIGKSKCLRKRVRSYFASSPKWEKVSRMVSMIRDIEYIVTDTHLEARLLECRLIKDHQPWFNAQMKNDRRYCFIKIVSDHKARPLTVVPEREADCFGPFRSKFTINEFIDRLRNIYPITRPGMHYDFEYHLFPAPMDREAFELNRGMLFEIFTSDRNLLRLIEALQTKMEKAAALYQYEQASVYRDMIRGFNIIQNSLNRYKNLVSRNILLKLPIEDGYKLFYVSGGSILHSSRVQSLTGKPIKDFLRKSTALFPAASAIAETEKSYIDYRDILYSEISDLPEDMYEFL